MITDADRSLLEAICGDSFRFKPAREGEVLELIARHRLLGQREMQERAAAYLDGYAGGHYMAEMCAEAIRAIEVG